MGTSDLKQAFELLDRLHKAKDFKPLSDSQFEATKELINELFPELKTKKAKDETKTKN